MLRLKGFVSGLSLRAIPDHKRKRRIIRAARFACAGKPPGAIIGSSINGIYPDSALSYRVIVSFGGAEIDGSKTQGEDHRAWPLRAA